MEMRRIIYKKGSLLKQITIYTILIAVLFGMFFISVAGRAETRGVKQKVLERQLALMIDSSLSGTEISIDKRSFDGYISDVRIFNERIYVDVDGLPSERGYPFFSRYSVSVTSDENKFSIGIGNE